MSLAILFHFLRAQHVSDINISIIRSLRLFCWITTLVVLFLVRCVLEFLCGWVGVVSVLQASGWRLFWDVAPCSLVNIHRRFGGSRYLIVRTKQPGELLDIGTSLQLTTPETPEFLNRHCWIYTLAVAVNIKPILKRIWLHQNSERHSLRCRE